MRFIVHGFKNRGIKFFSLLLSICIMCALFTLPSVVAWRKCGVKKATCHLNKAVIREGLIWIACIYRL
jgi:hypothetical protein